MQDLFAYKWGDKDVRSQERFTEMEKLHGLEDSILLKCQASYHLDSYIQCNPSQNFNQVILWIPGNLF